MKRKNFWAVFFSIVPGAGHMYLGLQRQGLQLMAFFFVPIFLTSWLRMSLLMVLVPIVWFYSFFDALKKVSSEEPLEDTDILLVSWFSDKNGWEKDKNKILGYGLIVIGVLLILNNITLPLISRYWGWQFTQYTQNAVVAILFILGGVKLLTGSKKRKGDVGRCGNGE